MIWKRFSEDATSKIEDMDDLNNIMSLGFRGEALYSISAVSDVVLQSQAGGLDGRDIHIRGGEKIGDKDISRSKGTTIEVRELFSILLQEESFEVRYYRISENS